MTQSVVPDRLETVLLARLAIPSKAAPNPAALAKLTQRFRSTTMTEPEWRALVDDTVKRLEAQQRITAERTLVDDGELKRRVGAYSAKKWEHWADKLLPALALGIALDDSRALRKLSLLDGWMSAIAARVLDLWGAGPPSFKELCDALVWRDLGLSGSPEPCPPTIRAHFLRKHIAVTEGTPSRLVRQIASQAVAAPRLELAAIRDSLVRCWLVGREPGATSPQSPALDPAALIAATREVVQHATDGVFGDRKVFISAAWQQLRAQPAWSTLALDDFKAALLAAHRRQALELVRADLVSAMDPELVAASETQTDGARFHFILRELH